MSRRPAFPALLTLTLAFAPLGAQLPATQATFGGAAVVTVPFREVHNLIVIPVTLNGRGPLQMILDTGAPIMLIPDTALARRLELNIVGQARVGGAGDGAVQQAPLAAGIRATVGALDVSGAVGITGIAGDIIPGVDGVIGGALLRHAVVEVDWDAHVVRFHDPAASTPRVAGDTLTLDVEPSLHAYIEGTVMLGDEARPIRMHLDTGSRQAFSLARSTLAGFRTTPDSAIPTIVGFGSRGVARGDYIRIQSLQLGGAVLRDIPTTVPGNEPTGAARVGLPVLRRFNLVVDYPGRRLILQRRADTHAAFPFTTTGIVLAPARDSTSRLVVDVMAGSPAARAGLLAGDSVVAVDGEDTGTLREGDIERLALRPEVGTTVALMVLREGRRRALRLVAGVVLP